MKITIGADPEFFVWDKNTKQYVSAHNLVPGDKEKPYKLKNGAVQVDGTAIEFNIAPAPTAFEFSYNIKYVLEQIRDMVPDNYDFAFKPSVTFSKEYWDKDVPTTAKELGCSPDYNAFNFRFVPNPPPTTRGSMRTGAGHIHVGWTKDAQPFDPVHFWDCREVARELYYVFRSASDIYDDDRNRQYLYGGGADFRPKPYGMEFRAPSNAWLNYPVLWPWVFDTTKTVFEKLLNGDKIGGAFSSPLLYLSQTNKGGKLKAFNKQAKKYGLPEFPENWKEAA